MEWERADSGVSVFTVLRPNYRQEAIGLSRATVCARMRFALEDIFAQFQWAEASVLEWPRYYLQRRNGAFSFVHKGTRPVFQISIVILNTLLLFSILRVIGLEVSLTHK